MSISAKDLAAGRVDLSEIADTDIPDLHPIHPGELLRTEWLDPMGLTPYRLSKDIGVPLTRILAIIDGRRGISADTALRLARYFGTDAVSWMALQANYDLALAAEQLGDKLVVQVKPRETPAQHQRY